MTVPHTISIGEPEYASTRQRARVSNLAQVSYYVDNQ
jgi:hypothetical protein